MSVSSLQDDGPRPFPLVGLVAIVSGIGLLLSMGRLEQASENWTGWGHYVLYAIAICLAVWGLRHTVTAMKPKWTPSRFPRWNRHRMAPTREGIVYIAIMSVMFIGSILGRSNMLMLVFAMMIGPWVLNGWIAFSMLRQTRAKRSVPHRAMVGELVSIDIDVENRKWLLGSWLLAARDLIVHPGDNFRASTLFVRIPARQHRRGNYFVRFSQRGMYSFGPIELTTHFPLGLVERGLVCDEFANLLVHPRIGRLTSRWWRDLWNATELAERRSPHAGLFDDEFHHIREFRSGDNPRAIHWRTSARRGELMVREYHQTRDRDLVVLVELWQPAHPTTSDVNRVELAVSFLATVVHEHLRRSPDARISVIVCGSETQRWNHQTKTEVLMDRLAVASAAATADLNSHVDEARRLRKLTTQLVIVSSRTCEDVLARYGNLADVSENLCLAANLTDLSPYFLLEGAA